LLKFIFAFVASIIAYTAACAAPIPPLDKSRAVYIYGPIDGNVLPLGAKLLEYAKADKTKPVNIILNSPGGEVQTGFIFIDYMERVKAQGVEINCYVKRLAASMAFQILLRCNNRYALDNSLLLWHPAKVFMMGALTTEQANAISEDLSVINRRIIRELVENMTGASFENIIKHFRRETLHFATDVVALTNGEFITTAKSIPDLIEVDVGTIPTTAPSDRFVMKVGRIYYVYEEGL
jgi:ATP-dependent Clp protease protease subunit